MYKYKLLFMGNGDLINVPSESNGRQFNLKNDINIFINIICLYQQFNIMVSADADTKNC